MPGLEYVNMDSDSESGTIYPPLPKKKALDPKDKRDRKKKKKNAKDGQVVSLPPINPEEAEEIR